VLNFAEAHDIRVGHGFRRDPRPSLRKSCDRDQSREPPASGSGEVAATPPSRHCRESGNSGLLPFSFGFSDQQPQRSSAEPTCSPAYHKDKDGLCRSQQIPSGSIGRSPIPGNQCGNIFASSCQFECRKWRTVCSFSRKILNSTSVSTQSDATLGVTCHRTSSCGFRTVTSISAAQNSPNQKSRCFPIADSPRAPVVHQCASFFASVTASYTALGEALIRISCQISRVP
jgi:hypothetical protein